MGVVIDRSTFDKYQFIEDPTLKRLIELNVLQNPKSKSAASYAVVKLAGSTCPFLTEGMDCSIQVALGEDYLSRTCDTYPRAYSKIDDTLERSLYLSCPEAARLILLRPGGIKLSAPELGQPEKYTDFPTVNTKDSTETGKPYGYFTLVRGFVMGLLRNRDLLVWERLVNAARPIRTGSSTADLIVHR